MLEALNRAVWILAFAGLCALWGREVLLASRHQFKNAESAIWICPIAGQCGPAGTPGLGRW
jgi:hypothetical protein